MRINIRAPIWSKKAIGIAERKARDSSDEFFEIDILYTDKSGNKTFPGLYQIRREDIFKYPIQTLKGGVKLFIIPIEELQLIN